MVKKALSKCDGSRYEENRYYICSIDEDAREFERAARGHWKIENNLHWQLDFTFKDDKNSSMTKIGAKKPADHEKDRHGGLKYRKGQLQTEHEADPI